MRLIIDIPEDDYELVQKYIYPQRVFYELVHGTPIPDNATVCDIDAIRAEPKTGHWIEENINEWSRKVFCSECGCTPPFEHVSNGDIYSAGGYGVNNKTKFCPNCGCHMVEPQEEIKLGIDLGDEVIGDYGAKGVVVGIDTDRGDVVLSLLMRNHKVPQLVKASGYKTKTGRHFPQIIEVLEQIKGEADGK